MPLEAAHNGGAYAGGTAHISGDLCGSTTSNTREKWRRTSHNKRRISAAVALEIVLVIHGSS
jgi:ribosome modulation factor